MSSIRQSIHDVVSSVFSINTEVVLTRPEPEFDETASFDTEIQ